MTLIEELAQRLNEADDDDAIAKLCRDHGDDVALQVIHEAERQRCRDRGMVPALTLLEDRSDGTWAVTLSEYGGPGGAASIASFDTKEEALAFIAANRGPTH